MDTRRTRRRQPVESGKRDLSVLFEYFEVHNRTEGKSPRTVEWYNQVLGLFYRWLRGREQSTELGNIEEMTVRRFIYLKPDRI